MDYIFYIIYNRYCKDGNYNNDIPNLTVGGIFTVLAFCLFLSVGSTILHLLYGVNHKLNNMNKFSVALIGWGCGLFIYFLFYYNKRYIKIYDRFKENAFANSWKGKTIGWLAVVLMMFSPFIVSFIKINFL